MEEMEKMLKKNKPNLSQSSISTYKSQMRNLMRSMKTSMSYILKNPKKTISFLEDKNKNTRKSILAMLVSLTNSNDYRKAMMDLDGQMRSSIDPQDKTAKQKENWEEWQNIKNQYATMYKRILPLMKKSSLSTKEKDEVVDTILLGLYVAIPPRRSADYALMKVRNYNEGEDNYLKKNKFYFNKFKTAKHYGKQDVAIPPTLKKLITNFNEKHDNDYLLFTKENKPLTSVRITNRLNKIFGKKISSTMLRHIYLSSVYKDIPALKEMEQRAEDMGHSLDEALRYVKKDEPKKRLTPDMPDVEPDAYEKEFGHRRKKKITPDMPDVEEDAYEKEFGSGRKKKKATRKS